MVDEPGSGVGSSFEQDGITPTITIATIMLNK
jgi:hypothetical protein